MAKTTTVADIRADLPVATKGGTAHKPIWTIGDTTYKFIKPLNKKGKDSEGGAVQLGKRVLAKYKAGTTKAGADLMFVGVFKANPKADETVPEVVVPEGSEHVNVA